MPRPNKRSMAAKKRQAELRSTEMQSKKSLGNALDELGSSDQVGRPCEAQPISKNLPIPSNTFQYPPIPSNTIQYLPKAVKTCQNLPTIVPEYPTNQPTVTNSVKEIASDCVCITEPCVPERSVLMGSFHQGHARFGNARNRQCGAISLTALLMCKMKSVLNWEPDDLDEVLVQGTVLYRSMRAQGKIRDHVDGRGYIAVSELPRRHRLWNCVFTIDFAEPFTGIVHVDDYDHALRDVAMPFDVAIQRTLLSNDACLLTICANTCAIVKEGSRFAFIDSHASGKVNQKGQEASCVAYFSSVESLFTFLYNFARCFGIGTPRFELTGVNARVIDGSTQMNNASSCTTSSANCLPVYSDVMKETWLNVDTDEEPQLPGYVFKHNPRGNCYDDSEPAFAALKPQQRGGVGVYCSENIDMQVLIPEKCNLECLYFQIPHANLSAVVLYRPSSYKIDMFREQLLQVIFELEKHPGRKIIMGDFNEDIFVSSTILKLLERHGYTQHVQAATTEKGTLIDHVYIKDTVDVVVEVVQTYYSFHEAILISLL